MFANRLLVVAALTLAPPDAASEQAKKDLEGMQGSWVLLSVERDGKAVSEDVKKTFRRAVKGDNSVVTYEDEEGYHEIAVALTLDAAANPKAIDVVFTDGPFKGKKGLGLYKLEGETLTTCMAPVGKDRPKEFTSTGASLAVWKRVKR